MNITRSVIRKILPTNDGLVGFASFVLDDCLFLNNVAIFTRLGHKSYRLSFPEKTVKDKLISYFHPLTREFYFQLEDEINKKFNI